MPDRDALAAEHGFSPEAVQALAGAIGRGGGGMAQFSHPELGGMGQWSRGGMLMIGAMNDHALKARVAALAEALAAGEDGRPPEPAEPAGHEEPSSWWPASLGRPSATGAQNGVRYAVFPDRHRVAIDENGRISIRDTGHRHLTGVSQGQSTGRSLAFTGPEGTVAASDLPEVQSP